jgi:hypothetical protein
MHSSSIIVYELLNCVLFMYVRARNVCILYLVHTSCMYVRVIYTAVMKKV